MPLTAAARKRLVSKSLVAHTELDDDSLVELARSGDADALDILLHRYTSYARAKAKTYFLIGADREDIIQEGMIGLFKAIRDFDPDKTVSFRSFAELCITRQIITAIKGATRQKHAPLNSYVSLHRPMSSDDGDGERQLVEFLAAARIVDPIEQVVAEDEVAQIRSFLADILSDLEVEVLNLYLEGRSYQEIAANLQRQAKSIDNALQRIKRKLETFLHQREQKVDEEFSADILELARFTTTETSHGANGSGQAEANDNGRAKVNGNGHANANGRAKPNGNGQAKAGGKPKTHGNGTRSPARSGDLRSGIRFAAAAAARRGVKASRAMKSKARRGGK